MAFGIIFSINVPDRVNLVICNKYMRKPLFCNFGPLILASKIDQQHRAFSKPFLGPPFLIFLKILFKMIDLGIPFKIRWAPKWQPKSTKWLQNVRNSKCSYAQKRVSFQTLFSRNHSNACAVGTSWLLKGHLSMYIG